MQGVIVEEIRDGGIFGEMGMVDPRPHTASVFAVTDVEAFVLNQNQFLQIVGHTPAFALSVSDLPVPDSVEPMCQTNPSNSLKRISEQPKLSRHSASIVYILRLIIRFQNWRQPSSVPRLLVALLMFSSPGMGIVISRPSAVNTRLL